MICRSIRGTRKGAKPNSNRQALTLRLHLSGMAAKRGSGWADTDRDGCDTRKEVLIEEAVVAPQIGERCSLTGGQWLSVYDNQFFTDSGGLDIDHFIPWEEVWQSGAHRWTDQQRRDLYNNLSNPDFLIAVSSSTNRSKGGRSPHEWLPPDENKHCWYVRTWIELKAHFDLAVDQAEREGLEQLLGKC